MKYALGSARMKEIDRYTIETIGIPSCVLMEKAAMAVAYHTKQICSFKERILAVCGYGNNGGDGIAAARILHMEGYCVAIAMIGEETHITEETKRQLTIAQNLGIPMIRNLDFSEYTVIIDGIFGIGLTRPIEGKFYKAIEEINRVSGKVISIDVPSGVNAENGKVLSVAVKADVTVTFGFQKIGCLLYPGAEYAGKVFVEEIGFAEVLPKEKPDAFYFTEKPKELLPARKKNSHKGTYGKVLIIAGSKQMSGAAYFSAAAAYRMGAGLVQVLTEKENREILLQQLPEAVITVYTATDNGISKEDRERAEAAIDRADVILLGPGIGTSAASAWLLDCVLKRCRVPLVIDADGLNLLSDKLSNDVPACIEPEDRIAGLAKLLPRKTILTPHKKELARLTGIPMEALIDCLIDSSTFCTYNNELIYVKKDARTVVSYKNIDYINVTGNNGMATAGSGDVLAGMITGLLAQKMEPEDAARAGVYLHGMAGDSAARQFGDRAMLARDILEAIPKILAEP